MRSVGYCSLVCLCVCLSVKKRHIEIAGNKFRYWYAQQCVLVRLLYYMNCRGVLECRGTPTSQVVIVNDPYIYPSLFLPPYASHQLYSKTETESNMHRLVALSIVLTAAWFSVATCRLQFPCDSRWRGVAGFSMFFDHCQCRYSNWTDWTIPENATSVVVPSDQCPSGMAWPEERWPKIISGYECEDIKREERHVCKLICNQAGMRELGTYNCYINLQ